MQKHTSRVIVAAVLIAAGVIGGFFVFTLHQRMAAVDAAAADIDTRIDRLIVTAGDFASVQQAYVAPGQPDQPWLERAAVLLQQFGQDAAAIQPLLQAHDSAAALAAVDKHFKAIVVIDGKAREDLQGAENLLAADLIFSEGHDTIRALVMALRGLEASEQQSFGARRRALELQQGGTLGAVALLWIAGLMTLVPLPRPGVGDSGSVNRGLLNLEPSGPESRTPDPDRMSSSIIDLDAAAGVCSALARTTDTAALREALARAATVLDARGLIVWIGAGEELFPALSHGYDEHVVERLGPIPRNAANATAEAWRTAQMRTVASDQMFDGALAAPLVGVSGCIGVLAAEVRHRREDDAATRAIAAIIAAQLAGILPAWPTASVADDTADPARLAASNG